MSSYFGTRDILELARELLNLYKLLPDDVKGAIKWARSWIPTRVWPSDKGRLRDDDRLAIYMGTPTDPEKIFLFFGGGTSRAIDESEGVPVGFFPGSDERDKISYQASKVLTNVLQAIPNIAYRQLTKTRREKVLADLQVDLGDFLQQVGVDLPRTPRSTAKPGAKLVVDLATFTVTLKGKAIPVKSERSLRWLRLLAAHRGQWFTGPELGIYDTELQGARTDHLRKRLPQQLQRLIETDRHRGARLKP